MASFSPVSLAPDTAVIDIQPVCKVVCAVVQVVGKVHHSVGENDCTWNHRRQQIVDVIVASEASVRCCVRDEIQSKIEDQICTRVVVVIKEWLVVCRKGIILCQIRSEKFVQEESGTSSQHHNSSSLDHRKVANRLFHLCGEVDLIVHSKVV